jgi:hypothetical protein
MVGTKRQETSNEKLYAERDPYDLSPQYERHMMALTTEGLHSKAAIAAELAFRDSVIEQLRGQLAQWERWTQGHVWIKNEEYQQLCALRHAAEAATAHETGV